MGMCFDQSKLGSSDPKDPARGHKVETHLIASYKKKDKKPPEVAPIPSIDKLGKRGEKRKQKKEKQKTRHIVARAYVATENDKKWTKKRA